MLAVLANTTVTGGDVSAVLASLREPSRHLQAQSFISTFHSAKRPTQRPRRPSTLFHTFHTFPNGPSERYGLPRRFKR